MSIMRCDFHNRRWDSDFLEQCPICFEEAIDAWAEEYSAEIGSEFEDIC